MSKYTNPNRNNEGQSENSALSAIRNYRESTQKPTGLQAISNYRTGLQKNENAPATVRTQAGSGLDAIRAYRTKTEKPTAEQPVQDQQPKQKIYYGEDTISQFYDNSPNGALYSQMFEYPEEYRNKMADMQVQRLQQKMQTAEKDLAAAEARAQGMVKRSEELATVAGNIEKLRLEYEQTGDEVKMQAYLIASENYNQMVQAYNADLQKLQKDEKVYDTYNQAYVNYERARLMQEQRLAAQAERNEKQRVAKMEQIQKLMDEDPAAGLVLAEADGRQISRTLDKLEDEKSALIRTGEAVDWDAVDAINEKIKGVEALQEQLLRAEANSKGWNSSGVNFVDRTISALGAGIHQGMAGVQAAIDMAMNPVEWLVSSTLVDVANITGNEDIMKEAEAWYQASKEYSDNAKDLSGIAQHYADQATARAGKVDGWILNNLQSVGGMMFDAATMGMAGAAGSAAGVTTGKIMAVRAAGNGMLDAAEKGYSTTEQLLVGVADGALEYVSEKMFGGNPIYDADGGFVTDALAKVIKNPKILRLMYSKGFDIAAEGLEEVFTEFLQPVAEGLITNTDIDWASPADLASAMAGGMFISLMGAGAQVMATEISGAGKAQRQAVRDAGAMIRNADAVQDLILEGLAAKKGTEAYELAVKLQTKMDAGETVSAMEIGRLLMANQEAIEAGYLTEDTKVEPDKKAPKGALTDPEQGFYAIRIRKTEDGRNGYRMVHVKPDGSIDVFGQQTNDLFAAKTAAEIEGYNIRHIGTEQQLYEAAIMEEAEYVKNHTYEEEQVDEEERIAAESVDLSGESGERIGAESVELDDDGGEQAVAEAAAPRNDSEFENAAETENTARAGGIDWAGNDYGKGVETNGRNETVVDRRAQGVETEAQKLGQSGNTARSGGYPAGSEDQRKARRTEAVSRRREEANRIRTYAADHGIPLRSAKDIGLETGSDIKNLRVLPKGFDKNVDETVELIENAGLRAVVVSGPIQMVIDGEEQYMNGVLHNGVIYVQADSISATPQQIAKHEVFHKKAAEDPELIDRLWDFARNHYDGNEIRRRYNQYYEAYKDVYTTADPDTLRHLMQEELLADAYAEYERYGEETLPGLTEEAWEQAWGGAKNTAADSGGERFSIVERFTDKEGNKYDSAVLLDADIFDGISPMNWGGALKKYLEKRIEKTPIIMPVVDENGNMQNLEFAKTKERVSKNGGGQHPVIGELYSTKDNISKLSAIHIDEIVEVSEESVPYHTGPDGHGWLDARGWLHRTAYVINNKNGKIYQITMDIAKARDGRIILYALNGKTKKVGNAEVNSLKIRGSSQNSNSGKTVAQKKQDVKMRFSLSEPVEETKDLIAVHNLHTAELLETLKLSGLPSPSVAIIKARDGHEKYGDVSLVLRKDAIDPQANKANRIYGSDAWTPTRSNAQVEYEVDYEKQRQFERIVETLSKNVADGVFSKSRVLGMAGIEDSTNLNLNEIARKISDYDAVQAAYVAESGGNVEVVYRTKEFDTYGNEALKNYIDKVGEQEVARLTAKLMTGERLTEEELEMAKDAIVENWTAKREYALKQKPELREIRIAKFREKLNTFRVEDFVRHAWEFYEDGGATTDEIDKASTGDNLRAAANRADVEAWVAEKLQGLLGEPGIYNGKDYLTPSGKRRSFKETHWDYTAENIVRAMNNADARGANVWNVSGEAVIATATPEYKSIDDVRADKSRLYKADDDYYEQIKDDISAELQTITKDIVRTTEHYSDNQYDEEQNIGRVIMEAAQGAKTADGVKRAFRKNGYSISDAQAKAILSLFNHASNVPTGYFEAKRQRVVGFEEVGLFVIPNNADMELKRELLNRGYNVAEYDPDIEGHRKKIVNSYEEYRFSVAGTKSEDKARQRAEKNIANGIGRIMSMPTGAVRKLRSGMIRELLEEYQLTGEVNADVLSDAVATAFAEGLVANNEFYETYKPVKDYLRSTPVMISEADQADIADFGQFKKKAFGTLRIVREGGLPVDVMYQEVREMAPGLLKPAMMHPADQLVQLYEKAKEIRKVEVPLERAMGEQADQFYEWAEGQILKLLEKELTKYADSVNWKNEGKSERKIPEVDATPDTYDRANERMYDYGQQSYYELPKPGSGIVQEDYIYPEEGGPEWASQMRAGNWLRDQERRKGEGKFDQRTVEAEDEEGQFVVDEFMPEPVVEEELTEEERARRGTAREWIQYVIREGVPPEEFAERMRRSAVGELKGGAKILVERMEETARQKRGDRVNLYRDPELTDEEYEKLNAAWKAHQEQKANAKPRETVVRKKDFESTPAMDKLGIKIDGSVTRYRATDMLRGYEKAAREAERMLDKRLKKMHASQEEIMFGKMLADGIMDVNSLNYHAINIERIAEIADYYMAKKSFDDDRLYQRKAEINQANDQIAKDLLTDREAFQPHLSGKLQPFTKMIMNERTPERVIKQIFGAEQGEKIFEFYFRPVWVNGNEMIRFKNRMLRRAQGYTDDKDTVGGFYDQDGKRRKLTEAEWGMAQRLLEGKAIAEEYEKLREDEKSKIAKAARALNDDMSLEEVSEKYQLTEGYQQGLAQAYADYLELNEVADKMDRVIMENAVKTYRQIYNEFYDAYNDFLVSHGHEEIGFIRNYAPHFQKQEVQHGLRAALRSMGVTNDKVTELPSEIAGRTADFKPSKKWNPHAMSRKGSQTDYDLLQGFQQYLDYAAEVFYHTDDVMRLRSAVKFLRGQYAAKEISAEIEGAFADMYKPVEWKTKRLRDVGVLKPDGIYTEREVNAAFEAYTAQLLEKASPESLVKWSEFTTWMENAANVIAGKQSVADRGTEFGGRLLLNAGNKLSSVFAKANVAGNLSSILNQTAQLPLLQVELGKYLEQAAVDIAKGGADADFIDRSDFLTEKKGVDVLTTDNVEKFVMALFKPAQMMDGLVSKLAVRGRFLKALDEGMTDEEAMKAADDFARRVMGSRMKGIRPQGFESKNWIAKMIHVFQLEGSNVFDYMLLSDMPQAVQHVAKTKGKKAAQRYVAATAAYYLVSAATLNAIVGSISGGSPAPFDIIGWLLTFVAGGWGRGDEEFLKTVIDNGTEKLFGERVFDTKRLNKERGFDWAGAVENAGYDVVNDIPFVSNIAGVMGWGDQTMPTVGINEMAEDLWSGVTTIFNQITGGEEKTGLDWAGAVGKSASDILNALSQAVPGGRQAKKTVQAARALILGGRYSGFGKNKKLMYTVDRGIASAAQGLLFGPSAWEETDNYYAGGKSLTAAQTQKAKTLKKHGVDVEDTYELYQDFAEINEELNAERIGSIEAKQQKRDLIAAMDLTDEQKMTVYMQTLASGDEKSKEKAEAKYTALLQDGVSWAQITDLENEFASFGEDADGDGERDMDSVDYGIARRNAIAAMDLNDWQKLEVFDRYMLDKNSNSYESTRAELETMLDEGLTWDDVTDAHNTYAMINADDTMNATQKATAYAKWADEQGWTDAQIEAAKERYMFWQMIPAEATSYEKFAGAGLSSDNAAKVVEVLSNLEPEAGKKSVSDVQRIEAIADGGFSTEDAKSAIRAILSETQTETFDDLMKSGLTPAQYAQYRRAVYGLEADKDENGNAISGSKKKKVLNAINKLPIYKALKTELYFAFGYGENTLDDAPWM